jgi:hypothetical protein
VENSERWPALTPESFRLFPLKARICKTEYSSQKKEFVLPVMGNFLNDCRNEYLNQEDKNKIYTLLQ